MRQRTPTTRVIALVLLAGGLGSSCMHDIVVPIDDHPIADTTMAISSTLTVLRLSTYDGSGQAVHPDFLTPVNPWSHRPRFLALTPYPFSDNDFENPEIYSGANGIDWTIAEGTPDPVVVSQDGYLSDPDIVYANARNAIVMYFREQTDSDRVYLMRSENGVKWEPPIGAVAAGPNEVLSPAVVRRSRDEWYMWSVNALEGCTGPSTKVERRYSSDGVNWSNPQPVDLPLGDVSAWHIDVQWIPAFREYWGLVPVKKPGTCVTQRLSLIRSPDGLHWTAMPNDVAHAGVIPAFKDIVYRSTFSYDPVSDAVNLWISGASFGDDSTFTWSTAAVRKSRLALFDELSHARADKPAEHDPIIDSLFVPPV